MAGDSFQIATGERRSAKQAWRYLWRAMCLRCPVCGVRPIFVPGRRVRNFRDWFTPLDGCPKCGYPYEREPGYFLLAVFGFNPAFAVFVGISMFMMLNAYADPRMPIWEFLTIVGLPIPIINVLVARHAKALFIALDHFVDPHLRHADDGSDDDDDDGIALLPAGPSGSGDRLVPGGGGDDTDPVPGEGVAEPAGVLVGGSRR